MGADDMGDGSVIERDMTRSTERTRWLAAGLTGSVIFAFLAGLGAQVAIPLPPDGVPQTLQTLVVILAAMCLGPRFGAASMGLYVLIGVVGGAVFAEGSKGFGVILGQTGGYLIGFIACQPVITKILRRRDGSIRGWGGLILASLAGHAVIFGIGVPWLAIVNQFSVGRALEGGFYPFVPGMIAKTALAVWIGRVAVPHAARRLW